MIGGVLKICSAAACVAAAALAGLLGWAGADTQGDNSAGVLAATGYSAALYDQIERARAGEPSSISDPGAAAADLIARAPLLDAPLALRGLGAAQAGELSSADRAFEAAFTRNPRNVPARLWLGHRALEDGRIDDAIDIISGLFAVSPDQRASYVEALAALARLPGGVASLEKRIVTQDKAPNWAGAVVTRVNALAPDLEELISLNRITPATQQSFITRMIAERGVEEGYLAWRSLVPGVADEALAWPYDNAFKGLAGPPPFNWRTFSDLVEFARGGGLNVTYLGRDRPVFLEQLMLLAPGAYTFTVRLSGDAQADGGGLAWAIACREPVKELGHVILRELAPSSSTAGFEFVVPAEACASQRLFLRGEPGEFPTRARAEIASVAITPAKGGR